MEDKKGEAKKSPHESDDECKRNRTAQREAKKSPHESDDESERNQQAQLLLHLSRSKPKTSEESNENSERNEHEQREAKKSPHESDESERNQQAQPSDEKHYAASTAPIPYGGETCSGGLSQQSSESSSKPSPNLAGLSFSEISNSYQNKTLQSVQPHSNFGCRPREIDAIIDSSSSSTSDDVFIRNEDISKSNQLKCPLKSRENQKCGGGNPFSVEGFSFQLKPKIIPKKDLVIWYTSPPTDSSSEENSYTTERATSETLDSQDFDTSSADLAHNSSDSHKMASSPTKSSNLDTLQTDSLPRDQSFGSCSGNVHSGSTFDLSDSDSSLDNELEEDTSHKRHRKRKKHTVFTSSDANIRRSNADICGEAESEGASNVEPFKKLKGCNTTHDSETETSQTTETSDASEIPKTPSEVKAGSRKRHASRPVFSEAEKSDMRHEERKRLKWSDSSEF